MMFFSDQFDSKTSQQSHDLRLIASFGFDAIFIKGDIANPVIWFYAPVAPDSLGQLLRKRLDNIGFKHGTADIIGRFKTGFLFGNLEGFTLLYDQI